MPDSSSLEKSLSEQSNREFLESLRSWKGRDDVILTELVERILSTAKAIDQKYKEKDQNHASKQVIKQVITANTDPQVTAVWTDGKCHHCAMRFTAMVRYQERGKKDG